MSVPADPRSRLHGDGGAAMIEFALALPLLTMFVLGLVEFGFAFKRQSQLEGVVASASRVAAQLGRDRSADAEVLRSIASGLSSQAGVTIERVVVWKANTSAVGPRCLTGNSVSGQCNVYGASQVQSPTGTFTGTDSCGSGSWDAAWCPTARVDTDRTQDYVGVYVKLRYPALTRVSTAEITLDAWNVMRIEPPLGMES